MPLLVQFDEVGMQIVQEDTVCAANNKADSCQNIVNKFHRVARNQEQIGAHGQEATWIMKLGGQQEMAAMIGKTREEP